MSNTSMDRVQQLQIDLKREKLMNHFLADREKRQKE